MGASKGRLVVGVLAVAAIISGIIALILSLITNGTISLAPQIKYGMVFDAGSSHTNLYIYQWPADKENDTGIVSQTMVCSVDGPGISSYASNPPQAGQSLVNCLNQAMTVIPAEKQKETPVYLGATAGMRLLRMQNSTQTEQVLDEVNKTIRQYPVDFRGARIITGEEEGSYGWITINYLLLSFAQYSFGGQWVHPQFPYTYGALDFGGASTQITFAPSTSISDSSTQYQFQMYGYNYIVYTHSYLCYGRDQSLKRIQAEVIQENIPNNTMSHPCYPKGYQTVVTAGSVYNTPCLQKPNSVSLPTNLTISGTGNGDQCLATVRRIFNFSACASNKDCAFNGIYQPPITGRFFAFSAFYYTFSFLNLTSGQPLSVVNATIQNFCARTWSDLTKSYPNEPSDKLRDYCAVGNFILVMLVDGYKFNEDNWYSLTFQQKAANTDIGWTLGYMLNLTNMIPAERPPTVLGHQYSIWAAAIFFIVFTLALTIVLLLVHIFT